VKEEIMNIIYTYNFPIIVYYYYILNLHEPNVGGHSEASIMPIIPKLSQPMYEIVPPAIKLKKGFNVICM
jgi:hypothetical protein